MTTKEINQIGVTIIDKIPPDILEPRLEPVTPKKQTATQRRRQKIYKKYYGHCAYCGCKITPDNFQIDHITPRSRYHKIYPHGNVNAFVNLNPSCRSCNKYKDTLLIEDLRHEIGQQIARLRKLPTFNLAERYGLIHCTPKEVKFYFEKVKEKK